MTLKNVFGDLNLEETQAENEEILQEISRKLSLLILISQEAFGQQDITMGDLDE